MKNNLKKNERMFFMSCKYNSIINISLQIFFTKYKKICPVYIYSVLHNPSLRNFR